MFHNAHQKHKAAWRARLSKPWTQCVTPTRCAAHPERQAAHGNVTYIDRCSCGAVRLSESNNGIVNLGPWSELWVEGYDKCED